MLRQNYISSLLSDNDTHTTSVEIRVRYNSSGGKHYLLNKESQSSTSTSVTTNDILKVDQRELH